MCDGTCLNCHVLHSPGCDQRLVDEAARFSIRGASGKKASKT